MKKVGILGGTFNPIHLGHLIMAEYALEQFDLDKVLFMPSKNPPHKSNRIIASDQHRKEMVRLAICNHSGFELSTIELDREGITYTADTLLYLTKTFPDEEYYFIIGADSFFQIETWKEPNTIFSLAHIVSVTRYNVAIDMMEEQAKQLKNRYQAQIDILDIPTIDLSSKTIRSRVEENRTIRYCVPDDVLKYINDNKLYTR